MNYAISRITQPVTNLENILKSSATKRDKGLFFYQNKGRDVLFRLEGLTRIYRNIHDKKFFDTWYKEWKTLEDLLGKMDFYESVHNELSKDRKLKAKSTKAFGEQYNAHLEELNQKLKNEHWLSGEKMAAFRAGIAQCTWLESHEDRAAFGHEMINELSKLHQKYESGELNPYNIEEGLHEFRRRLRWIGIYSIASEGMVQLQKVKTITPSVQKYQTKEIVASPYNIMPAHSKGQHTINIQSQHFYAMSWLIQQLGEWKDRAQHHEALKSIGGEISKANASLVANIPAQAEMTIDEFVYSDLILMKISRDILRSVQ
jgi:hypothetical protein